MSTITAHKGKIRFTSPEHAREVQTRLLEHGYKFPHGTQEPRDCYGVMFKDGVIRSAGNAHAFRAYSIMEVQDFRPFEITSTQQDRGGYAAKVWREMQRQEHERITNTALKALEELTMYHDEIFTKNSRLNGRVEAWKAFIFAVLDKAGNVRPNTLYNAMRAACAEQGRLFCMPGFEFFKEKVTEWNQQSS